MFRFAHIEFLYGLLLIPILIFIFILMWKWRKNALRSFGNWPVISKLIEETSNAKTKLKLIFQLLAFLFLVLAAAGPQIGSKYEESKRKGSDIIIVLDISNSMLAEDLTPNRLERAKLSISKIIDDLKGDRIGLIVFAGEAFVQLPITSDYSAAKLFINTISTNTISTQGTAIGNAISLAIKSFGLQNESTALKSKAIVIITDGENHEDNAISETQNAISQGITVHTIGMGSPNGAPIPEYRNKVKAGFRKDKENNTIVSKLNEEMLKEIASEGKGIYVRANNSQNGLKLLLEEFNKMEKQDFESKSFTDYEEQFQYFVGISLLFLIVDFFLSRRKYKWLKKFKLFESN